MTAKLSLTKEQYDFVDGWLSLWGAWSYSGRIGKRMTSVIAQYMESVQPKDYPFRPVCSDEHGMIVDSVIRDFMLLDKQATEILISLYVYGASRRSVAKGYQRINNKSLSTARRHVDDIINSSQYILCGMLQRAFNDREKVHKFRKVA